MSSLAVSRRGVARCSTNAARTRLIAAWLAVAALATVMGGAARAADDDEDTKPEDITLRTKDGVELRATYYPTTLKKEKEKREAVPVVLLHAWKGDRGDCAALAKILQEQGRAVLAPDLRGHGDSKTMISANGDKLTLDANTLRPDDFQGMVYRYGDMEAIKSYLTKKNNEGQLNIDRLGVVGAEMGASVAVNWAALDWDWPILATGKQGQDVKALVLISPEINFKGLGITGTLRSSPISQELSFFILVGKKATKALNDAKKLEQTLKPMHPDPPEDEVAARKTLFFVQADSSLQGMKLLNANPKLCNNIAKFIELRLETNLKTEWEDRRSPLDSK